MAKKIRLAISLGDPGGIGTEVTLKAICKPEFKNISFVLFGNLENSLPLFKKYKILFSEDFASKASQRVLIHNIPIIKGKIALGKLCKTNGQIAFDSLVKAVDAIESKLCDGLITAPLHKKAVKIYGQKSFQGHTEYLQERDQKERVVMLLAGGGLRVALITRHTPYHTVPKQITIQEICTVTKIVHDSLEKFWKIKNPHIGVLGLNPHASDGGMFGDEEEKIILPAIKKMKKNRLNVSGPYAPDSAFHFAIQEKWDAEICMYHDQGLIPLKTISFDSGVNITLGLSYVRTSPDHGTAFDIAGKGIASEMSMVAAIRQAIEMIKV